MHLDNWFGDSYDIVKQSILRWLSSRGKWAAHPMFTESIDTGLADEFSEFLDVRLVSREVLDRRSDREAFLKPAKSCQANLFLDPDTGLRLPPSRPTPKHLMGAELVEIAKARPKKLTLVFDQSLSRSSPRNEQPNEMPPEAHPDKPNPASDIRREQIKKKLCWLAERGVHGVAYESHACFVLVSASRDALDRAERTLLKNSRLPPDRLVRAKEDGG